MGMEQAGHECVGYVEMDKFARKSYEAIYDTEGEWTAHDITEVTNEEWRELRGTVDVITGGFPCQAFSIAGKRGGFSDTRGTLFFEIARAAEQIKPRILLLENVKGLLSHDKGKTFATILSTLDELGYDAEWQVINSKNFGVPQNRERVFIIGHLRGTSRREVFPIGTDDEKTYGLQRQQITTNTLTARYEGVGNGSYIVEGEQHAQKIKVAGMLDIKANDQNRRVYDTEGISPSLTTMQGGGQEPKIIDDQGRIKEKYQTHDIAPTLRTQSHGNEPKVVMPALTPNRLKKRQNGRRFKENGEPSFTLTSQDRHGVYDGYKIRKLTPKECWRLQGFPDWAFDKAAEVNSDSQLYKQAGNSVTVNVIYEIAKRLEV